MWKVTHTQVNRCTFTHIDALPYSYTAKGICEYHCNVLLKKTKTYK